MDYSGLLVCFDKVCQDIYSTPLHCKKIFKFRWFASVAVYPHHQALKFKPTSWFCCPI